MSVVECENIASFSFVSGSAGAAMTDLQRHCKFWRARSALVLELAEELAEKLSQAVSQQLEILLTELHHGHCQSSLIVAQDVPCAPRASNCTEHVHIAGKPFDAARTVKCRKYRAWGQC